FELMFEFSVGIFFLAKTGVITYMSLLRYGKPATLIFFVVGGMLTPPEPVSQSLMAVPMPVLFFASVGVAYMASKVERERVAKSEAELAAEAAEEEESAASEPSTALVPANVDADESVPTDPRRAPAG